MTNIGRCLTIPLKKMNNRIKKIQGNRLEITHCAEILSSAFMTDPFYNFVFPDAERRARLLPWLSRKLLAYAARYGVIFTDANFQGVSIWLGPNHTDLLPLGIFQTGLFVFPFKVSRLEFKRSTTLAQVSNHLHKQVISTPHYYLQVVGVEPSQQGKGLGRALVQAGLSRADELKVPCYLETYNSDNLRFYSSLGFKVLGSEKASLHAPSAWGLLRDSKRTCG